MIFDNGVALIIAIANYKQVSSLPITVINDAKAILETIVHPDYCGYNPTKVVSLIDSEATLDAIRRELDSISVRSKSQDTVFIYFSGHGTNVNTSDGLTSGLVPVDCDLNNIENTLLLEPEFSAAIKKIVAERVVVVIDSCHSGGSISFKALTSEGFNISGFDEKSLSHLAQGKGRVVIASSRASETSLILGGASNSLFTEHFVAALKGAACSKNDGFVRVFDTFEYVSDKVKTAAPGRQHPIFKATDLEDNFPIALEKGGQKALNINSNSSHHNPQAQKLNFDTLLSKLYPLGPLDQEIWARAGGDVSRLSQQGSGSSRWFSAIRLLDQGGGGTEIDRGSLVQVALQDFPNNIELRKFL